MIFRFEYRLGLGQELLDNVHRVGAGIDFVSVRGQIPFQHIQPLIYIRGGQHIGNIIIRREALPAAAQRQKFIAVFQHLFGYQIIRDVLNRPAGDDGDGAGDGIAVAGGEQLHNILHAHGPAHLIIPRLNLLAIAQKICVIFEHGAVMNQPLRFQIIGHFGQAGAGSHGEGDGGLILGVHGREEMPVDPVIARHYHPGHHQHHAQRNQQRPQQMPQPAVPEQAVLPLLPQLFLRVILMLFLQGRLPFPAGAGSIDACYRGMGISSPAAWVKTENRSASSFCRCISASR